MMEVLILTPLLVKLASADVPWDQANLLKKRGVLYFSEAHEMWALQWKDYVAYVEEAHVL